MVAGDLVNLAPKVEFVPPFNNYEPRLKKRGVRDSGAWEPFSHLARAPRAEH